MHLRQLPHEEILENLSHKAEAFLDPFRDTLAVYRDRTEIIRAPFSRSFGANDEGRLTLNGFTLHPHIEKRFFRKLLGITVNKHDFWLSNPDLAAEALRRFAPFPNDPVLEMRVIDGQIVYITNLFLEYGHHIDLFDPMAKMVSEKTRKGRPLIALVGYLLDPMWAHIRLMIIPRTPRRTFGVGFSLDTNYTFSRFVRGRAGLSLFGYSYRWHSMLTMDNFWGVRTSGIKPNTNPDMAKVFAERVQRSGKKVRDHAKERENALFALTRRVATRPWRQRVLTEFGESFCGHDAVVDAFVEYERSGSKNPVELMFALSTQTKDYAFNRRITAERILADHLRKMIGGPK